MTMKKINRINHKPPWEEVFPELIGFCERDDDSYVNKDGEEYYDYQHDGELVYKIGKTKSAWIIEEYYASGELAALSEGPALEQTIFQALIAPTAKENDERVNILVPVEKENVENAKLFMYMIGGYPGSWLSDIHYEAIKMSKLYSPKLDYLCYRKIPREYVDWVARILSERELLPLNQKVYIGIS